MFIKSPELLERIQKVSDDINKRSGGLIVFEEYIAVPIFGFVTLRFELLSEEVTRAELDGYERLMQEAAGDEFQVDFMGSVYKKAGVSLQAMQARFAQCREAYEGEAMAPSRYADRIRADAAAMLKLFSLPVDSPVWEIQVNDELDMLVFGDERREPRRYDSDRLAVNLFTLSPADRIDSDLNCNFNCPTLKSTVVRHPPVLARGQEPPFLRTDRRGSLLDNRSSSVVPSLSPYE